MGWSVFSRYAARRLPSGFALSYLLLQIHYFCMKLVMCSKSMNCGRLYLVNSTNGGSGWLYVGGRVKLSLSILGTVMRRPHNNSNNAFHIHIHSVRCIPTNTVLMTAFCLTICTGQKTKRVVQHLTLSDGTTLCDND